MKKALKKISFALFSAAILFTFAACSSGDDNSGSGDTPVSPVTLPEATGENPFKGKTFSSNKSKESDKMTYTFSDKTVKYIEDYTEDGVKETKTFNYTYDANKSLLYLSLINIKTESGGKTYSWSSAGELLRLQASVGYSITGDEYDFQKVQATNDFSLLYTYKYKITDEEIELDAYFDGKLPTYENFYFYDSTVDIELWKNTLEIEPNGSEIRYKGFPTFTTDSFEVTIFKVERDSNRNKTYKKIGTIKGTYKTEGTGTENCKIILTFTEMPEELSSYKDKGVTLSNYSY